jgi:formate dehydrogenase iron-sulfur subunit
MVRHRSPAPDPAGAVGWAAHPDRVGFFTDTSICIGCKACEVACKEWNLVPDDILPMSAMSYDNTRELSADSWRHVQFVEQHPGGGPPGDPPTASGFGPSAAARRSSAVDLGMPGMGPSGVDSGRRPEFRWLMASDVCKHCTEAACLDVCPTGALFRTEFGTVVVQEDICNGCGYCVPACPYGVIDKREDDGRVWKCTLCYDRLHDGLEPACAKACPTESIQFGPLDELRERAALRVEQLHEAGVSSARLYGEDPADGVGGAGAFFLLLDEPETYGFPPDPKVTTRDLPAMWRHALVAAGAILVGIAASALGGGPRGKG